MTYNITCKEMEKWCLEHSAPMKPKSWEYYCLMNDSFLEGATTYRNKLQQHLEKQYDTSPGGTYVSIQWVLELLETFGTAPLVYETNAHGVGPSCVEKQHGQPVQYYKDNKLVNGYWDYKLQKEVDSLEQLSL